MKLKKLLTLSLSMMLFSCAQDGGSLIQADLNARDLSGVINQGSLNSEKLESALYSETINQVDLLEDSLLLKKLNESFQEAVLTISSDSRDSALDQFTRPRDFGIDFLLDGRMIEFDDFEIITNIENQFESIKITYLLNSFEYLEILSTGLSRLRDFFNITIELN